MTGQTRLSQIQIRNYKNIAAAAIDLQPLTVLVGPNGAGKSNLVDALSFVADSLSHSVQRAFANRGGVAAVRRRPCPSPCHIGLRFVLALQDGGWADYAFDIAAPPRGSISVARERCIVQHYSLDELRTLCLDLGVNDDELGGEGLSARTRELLLHLGRRGGFAALLARLAQQRSKTFDLALTPDALYAALPAWSEAAGRSAPKYQVDTHGGPTGIVGAGAHVEGRIHFHTHTPPPAPRCNARPARTILPTGNTSWPSSWTTCSQAASSRCAAPAASARPPWPPRRFGPWRPATRRPRAFPTASSFIASTLGPNRPWRCSTS